MPLAGMAGYIICPQLSLPTLPCFPQVSVSPLGVILSPREQFWLSQLQGSVTSIERAEARVLLNVPKCTGQPTARAPTAQNVNNIKAEKPCPQDRKHPPSTDFGQWNLSRCELCPGKSTKYTVWFGLIPIEFVPCATNSRPQRQPLPSLGFRNEKAPGARPFPTKPR